jgi:hypothetical protein
MRECDGGQRRLVLVFALMVRKPSYFKKAGTNWQGSRVISKNLARNGKEAELFQKT